MTATFNVPSNGPIKGVLRNTTMKHDFNFLLGGRVAVARDTSLNNKVFSVNYM